MDILQTLNGQLQQELDYEMQGYVGVAAVVVKQVEGEWQYRLLTNMDPGEAGKALQEVGMAVHNQFEGEAQ